MTIKWKRTKYNGAKADLGNGLNLFVCWEGVDRLPRGEPRWNIYVFDKQVMPRAYTMEEAMARAVETARQWINEIQEKLIIPTDDASHG